MTGGKVRKKVAIVCILKNEYAVLPSWLCWHRLLGFEHFIIFDDGSTDGCWELLCAAKDIYNIDLHRASMFGPGEYILRQEEAYKFAISTYKDDFEWLFPIDADEFLSFSQASDVSNFLDRFDHVDGIAVNWCQYGSNGHVLDPDASVVEAYTRHGPPEGVFASHVKSFIRPEAFAGSWINVHCFDLPSDRYVDASGQPVEWGHTPGISARAPDWSVAKIMHFQVRSMQSFVERTKKHRNLRYTTDVFRQLDTNNFEDISPLARKSTLDIELRRLRKIADHFLIKIFLQGLKIAIERNYIEQKRHSIRTIKTFHDTYIAYDRVNKCLIQVEDLEISDKGGEVVYIYKVFDFAFFVTFLDGRPNDIGASLIDVIGFARMTIADSNQSKGCSFAQVGSQLLYSAEIGTTRVTIDKSVWNSWETFELIDPPNENSLEEIARGWMPATRKPDDDAGVPFEVGSVVQAFDARGIFDEIRSIDKDDAMLVLRSVGLDKGCANAIYNNRQ